MGAPSEGVAKALQISILQAFRSSFSFAILASSSGATGGVCAAAADRRRVMTEAAAVARAARFVKAITLDMFHLYGTRILRGNRSQGESPRPKNRGRRALLCFELN
jgi:hypothetical protein